MGVHRDLSCYLTDSFNLVYDLLPANRGKQYAAQVSRGCDEPAWSHGNVASSRDIRTPFRFNMIYCLFIFTLYLLMPIFGATKPMPDAAFDYSGHSLSSVGFGCSLGFAAYLIRAFPFLLDVFFDSRKKAYGCYVPGLISPQPLEKRIDISSGR